MLMPCGTCVSNRVQAVVPTPMGYGPQNDAVEVTRVVTPQLIATPTDTTTAAPCKCQSRFAVLLGLVLLAVILLSKGD